MKNTKKLIFNLCAVFCLFAIVFSISACGSDDGGDDGGGGGSDSGGNGHWLRTKQTT